MKVTGIKTHKITVDDTNICAVLDQYVPKLSERSVVAVTSKIVAICEGRVVSMDQAQKDDLVEKEAELFLPASENKYGFHITVKHNMLIASAGIDESNGNGSYIFWPKEPQTSANRIRAHLVQIHGIQYVGVIITDSKTTPLRWGVTGTAIAHSGFAALENYIDKPDIFGRKLHVTKANIMDGLAAAAVLIMGEGSEQTPLAVIDDLPAARQGLPFVQFQDRNPTQEELDALKISIEEDIYAPILKKASWQKKT